MLNIINTISVSTIKLNENMILNPITVQPNFMTVQCLQQYQPNTLDVR